MMAKNPDGPYANPNPNADPGTTPISDALTPRQQSAKDIVGAFFAQFGLQDLANDAWRWYLDGDSLNEILLKIRDTQAYRDRFPGMADLAARGQAIDEQTYIQYEQAITRAGLEFGIPSGIYDNRAAMGKLIGKGYSPVEIRANMERAAGVVYGSPQVREAFTAFYGAAGDGAAIAYFLDPEANQQELERRYYASLTAGAALEQGLGMTKDTAERVAGVINSPEQAQQVAYMAGRDAGLYSELFGESTDVTADQGVLAAAGVDSGAARAVEQRRAQRQAQYQGGGQVAVSQTGVSGLSSARQ